jgi:hypothetical protein
MDVDWYMEARGVLRAELARRNITYKTLVELLQAIGVQETERSVATKLARGSFSFAFFLQSMKALGCTRIDINIENVGPQKAATRRRQSE